MHIRATLVHGAVHRAVHRASHDATRSLLIHRTTHQRQRRWVRRHGVATTGYGSACRLRRRRQQTNRLHAGRRWQVIPDIPGGFEVWSHPVLNSIADPRYLYTASASCLHRTAATPRPIRLVAPIAVHSAPRSNDLRPNFTRPKTSGCFALTSDQTSPDQTPRADSTTGRPQLGDDHGSDTFLQQNAHQPRQCQFCAPPSHLHSPKK